MRNYSQYDIEMFNKVLLKIKTLLDQGSLETIPEFDIEDPGQGNGKSKYMELYSEAVRVSIEMITPPWGEEIWQVEIISVSDGNLRYRGRGNVNGNAIACEIYRLYKEKAEMPEPGIDEFVDGLFSC